MHVTLVPIVCCIPRLKLRAQHEPRRGKNREEERPEAGDGRGNQGLFEAGDKQFTIAVSRLLLCLAGWLGTPTVRAHWLMQQ